MNNFAKRFSCSLLAFIFFITGVAIEDGMLTGESDAEVEDYAINVHVRPMPLEEDEVANLMLRRIESGSLRVEDIPTRLARYGLMDADAFTAEMRERLDNEKNDG